MPKRPDALETTLLAIELLRRIPRGRKITTGELHQQLKDAGLERDLRTIQRQLEMLSQHFDIERDERSKPYGYRWLERSQGLALPHLTPQESLLLQLAQEHLKHLLPARLMQSMDGFFAQARRNLDAATDAGGAQLERQWPRKVRVVATSQPLLAPTIAAGVFEPSLGLTLRPEIAALSMSGSSFLVAVNAVMLKRLRLPAAAGPVEPAEDVAPVGASAAPGPTG